MCSSDLYGLWGPANLPGEIAQRLNAEVNRALASTEFRERLTPQGLMLTLVMPTSQLELAYGRSLTGLTTARLASVRQGRRAGRRFRSRSASSARASSASFARVSSRITSA